MDNSLQSVWIFNGQGGRFPGSVFIDKSVAEDWIRKHKLTLSRRKRPVAVAQP
jgi:hypothetical protein